MAIHMSVPTHIVVVDTGDFLRESLFECFSAFRPFPCAMLLEDEMAMLVEMGIVPEGSMGIPLFCVDMQYIEYVPDPIVGGIMIQERTVVALVDGLFYLLQNLPGSR